MGDASQLMRHNVPMEEPGSLLDSLGENEDADETGGEQTKDDPEGRLTHVRVVDELVDRDGLR